MILHIKKKIYFDFLLKFMESASVFQFMESSSICKNFTQTLKELNWSPTFFHPFLIKKNKNKSDPRDSSGPHVGASGCRGYVYLQIKPSVPKQYLPGLFR